MTTLGAIPHHLRLGAQTLSLRFRLDRMLRRHSLPGLLGALTPRHASPQKIPLPAVEDALLAAERVIERLRVVPDTCLYRALARYAVLRGAGHPVRFVMGLSPRAPDIEGHAWVELDGAPMGETVDDDMVITYAYPQP
ncbi:MAG: lasso peptide biosynthesis B2 protein [Byssovorax sp.]